MRTLTDIEARDRIGALAPIEGRPFLLGLVGAPGAGKSTLSDALGVPVLPMDGFHFANEHLDRRGLRQRKGAPETFDVGGYVSILARLRAGEDVLAPRFDRDLDEAVAGAIPLAASDAVIVTEGNYLLHDAGGWEAVRAQLDEVWFIDVDDELRRSRLVDRHVRFGRTVEDARAWVDAVDEPNALLIRGTRERATAIITLS